MTQIPKFVIYADQCPNGTMIYHAASWGYWRPEDRQGVICWHEAQEHADMCCKLLKEGKQELWQAMHDELKETP